MSTPSPNGTNGRCGNGRFAVGNAGGPGNPHVARVAKLRAVLLDAVTEDDLRAVVAKLVGLAKCGDIAAIKLLLERTIGKPPQSIELVADVDLPRQETSEEIHARLDAIAARIDAELAELAEQHLAETAAEAN